jgi:branched-chain amino acid transport system substrate-binding protein
VDVKAAAAVLPVLLAAVAAGCGGGGGGAEAVAATSCGRVLYEGTGKPDVVIVSDFPLRGVGAENTRQMVRAVELVLRKRAFRAGEHRVGYQSCNDTVGDEPFDTLLCKQNARAYVSSEDVVGIVGPWNSGCAAEQIPIVSRRSAGPLAMISPSNTYTGLTRTVRRRPGASLYPDGVRSYARVVPHDFTQGVAAAQLAAVLGARRVVVLHQDFTDDYVLGLTGPFRKAASDLGMSVRSLRWTREETYERLARNVAAARPDAVYLAGLTQVNAKRLVEDLRAAVGPDAIFIAPDSFAAEDIARELGPAGEGLYATEPGTTPDRLPPTGRRFLRALGLTPAEARETWAPEAAQAAEVLLDAIARSDGSRASVVREVRSTRVRSGILGSFSFDAFGDVVPAPVTIYRIRDGRLVTDRVTRVPAEALSP